MMIPLICSPRTGSSLVESLLGESPEVAELQEMFSNLFAHAPHGAALQTFFGQHLLDSNRTGQGKREDKVQVYLI